MIERQKGQIIFVCDGDDCDVTSEHDEDRSDPRGSFRDAWSGLKEDGWTARKSLNGEYEHYCPGCARKL